MREAMYTGVMLGVDTNFGPNHGDRVQGDARLTFKLKILSESFSTDRPSETTTQLIDYPHMDLFFTNIQNLRTGTVNDRLEFRGIVVDETGRLDNKTGTVNGAFYGPNHEEVGGTFSYNNLRGAFGTNLGSGSRIVPESQEPTMKPDPQGPIPPQRFPKIPLQQIFHAPQAPIVDFDGSLHIGAGVAPPKNQLSQIAIHNSVPISTGMVRDGVGRRDIVDFIGQFVDGTSLSTFASPPVVRIAEGAIDQYTNYVVRAVQFINATLPYDKRIILSNDPSSPLVPIAQVPDGQIFIDFSAAAADWNVSGDIPFGFVAGLAESSHTDHPNPQRRASRIWINTEFVTDAIVGGQIRYLDEEAVSTIAHELLHAIGFSSGRGHADPVRFPESIMVPEGRDELPKHVLGAIDRETILAIYSKIETGALSAESLGPWNDTSFHVRGDIDIGLSHIPGGDVSFGVAFRNGLAQPWASGPTPWTSLADNNELSETATWNGALLGITNSEEVVVGDASLAVDLTTRQTNINGQLDFTGLEHWGVREAPGEAGTSMAWGDGDLRYSIIVRGNTFIETGGDAGEITGAFFGPSHEGMGGVLERSDLSAGFGGKR